MAEVGDGELAEEEEEEDDDGDDLVPPAPVAPSLAVEYRWRWAGVGLIEGPLSCTFGVL